MSLDDGLATERTDLIDRCVVHITTPSDSGTGFFVTPTDIVTCLHVVADHAPAQIGVMRGSEKVTVLKVLRASVDGLDLAILVTSAQPGPFPLLAEPRRVNSAVYAMTFQLTGRGYAGYPLLGTFAGYVILKNSAHVRLLLITDTIIHPGASGAPVFSPNDQAVIGIVKRQNPDGGGYAVPVTDLDRIDETLRSRNATAAGRKESESLAAYRRQLAEEHRFLTLPGLGRAIALDEIYVTLTLHRGSALQTPSGLGVAGRAEATTNLSLAAAPLRTDQGHQRALYHNANISTQEFLRTKHAIVLGEPGSGKTTFLRHLLSRMCSGGLLHDDVPIFVPLRNAPVDAQPVRSFVASAYADIGLQLLASIKAGEAVIFADGFDELLSPQQGAVRDELVRIAARGNRVYLSCRLAAWREGFFPSNFRSFECAGFNRSQQLRFLRRWFDGSDVEPQEVMSELDAHAAYAGWARNPLLLTLLAHWLIEHQGMALPGRRHELYGQVIQVWMDRRSDDAHTFDGSPLERALSRFAFEQFIDGREEWSGRQIADALTELGDANPLDFGRAEKLMSRLTGEYGLMVRSNASQYRFLHLTFQEYLAARELSRQPAALASVPLFEPRWEEVIRLVLQMAPDGIGAQIVSELMSRGQAASSVSAFDRSVLSAARCLAEAPSVSDDVCMQWATRLFDGAYSVGLEYQSVEIMQTLALLLRVREGVLLATVAWWSKQVGQADPGLAHRVIQLLELIGSAWCSDALRRTFEHYALVAGDSHESGRALAGMALRAMARISGPVDDDWVWRVALSEDTFLGACACVALAGRPLPTQWLGQVNAAAADDLGRAQRLVYVLARSPKNADQALAFDFALQWIDTDLSVLQSLRQSADVDLLDLTQAQWTEVTRHPRFELAFPYLAPLFANSASPVALEELQRCCLDRARPWANRIAALESWHAAGMSETQTIARMLVAEGSTPLVSVSLHLGGPLADSVVDAARDASVAVSIITDSSLVRHYGARPNRRAVPALMHLFGSAQDEALRAKALMCLARVRAPTAMAGVQEELNRSSVEFPVAKAAAYQACALFQSRPLCDALLRALRVDTSVGLIAVGLQALGLIHAFNVEEDLLQLLDSRNWPPAWPEPIAPPRRGMQRPGDRRRIALIFVLAQHGGAKAAEALQAVAQDGNEDADTANAAWGALETIRLRLGQVAGGD